MKFVYAIIATSLGIFIFVASWNFIHPPKEVLVSSAEKTVEKEKKSEPIKTLEERIQEARERSKEIKGLYMTADVANDQGVGATRLRNSIISLAETTEINGIVIDVKEVCGIDYNEMALKKLLEELATKNIWAIARIVVMSDSSEIEVHPEWYLTRKTHIPVGGACANKKYLHAKTSDGAKSKVVFWQDKPGKYWIDPASRGARQHVLDFSKKIADLGFNELQYDYFRFPSDGDIQNAIYPAWDGTTSKCRVIRDYFEFLSKGMKAYKPEIILSVDLFGYASVGLDTGIGQCLDSLEDNFDVASFMVYPSHYYSGFHVASIRGLSQVDYKNSSEARMHPDVIVGRSMAFARDFFDGKVDLLGRPASTTAATTSAPLAPVRSYAILRPWLEDFFHEQDAAAPRPSGAQKVRMQIDAAEQVGHSGWLLWNAANVYTTTALKKE